MIVEFYDYTKSKNTNIHEFIMSDSKKPKSTNPQNNQNYSGYNKGSFKQQERKNQIYNNNYNKFQNQNVHYTQRNDRVRIIFFITFMLINLLF